MNEKHFKNPSSEFYPIVCWFWTGDITETVLKEQLRELKGQGFREILIYPGFGMKVPYLSDDYFDCYRLVVEEAVRLRLHVWLYDEYNWPSGTVAGKVIRDYPEYKMVYLRHFYHAIRSDQESREVHMDLSQGQVICARAIGEEGKVCELDSKNITVAEEKQVLDWSAPPGHWEIAVFVQMTCQSKLPYTVGGDWVKPVDGYVDTLNPQGISKFIQYTHEQYYKYLGDYFGNVIRGIFTDEASLCRPHSQASEGNEENWHKATGLSLPWSKVFAERFKQRKKYDLVSRLPDLVLDRPDALKTRKDYWEVVTATHEEAYYKQIGDWCREHGIQFLGHPLFEEPLVRMLFYMGDFFQTQRHLHIPGIDNIFGKYGFDQNRGEYGSEPIACKLASSTAHLKETEAANQSVRRVVCESFAVSPKDYTLEDIYRMTDWLAVLGVNMMFAVGYPSSEESKKYFPMFHDLTRHFSEDQMNRYNDYAGRLSFMLTRGVHRANIGLLFPTSTYWLRNNRTFIDDPQWRKMEEGFNELSIALLKNQLDFDYLFEAALPTVTVDGKSLSIGGERFSTVVIPPVNVLSPAIREKLRALIQNSGRVVAFNPLEDLDGIESVASIPELLRRLESERTLKIQHPDSSQPDILYHQRSLEDREIYFILNSGAKMIQNTEICLRTTGKPQLWNLRNGETSPLEFTEDNGTICLSLPFEPYQSYLIVVIHDNK